MSEIWVINRGSSSLKLARYDAQTGTCLARSNQAADAPLPVGQPIAIGHRVVHGATRYTDVVRITDQVLADLSDLCHLAPLHQPHNLAAIEALKTKNVPQFACFDTAFHRTQLPEVCQMAVPEKLRAGGVQNYGFHGLSYQYIASQLGPKSGRWVVLHLGSGASACALLNGVSLGTSMGFSALDGLVMGTRPGRIDPGAVLHWWQQGFSHDELVQALYQQSGLQGLAGESDMRVLLGRNDPDALHAVEHFCLSAARAVGDMAVILGGIDGLVLTGGIGENSKTIRDDIAQRVQFLTREIRVIKTDEEGVIARAVLDQIRGSDSVH